MVSKSSDFMSASLTVCERAVCAGVSLPLLRRGVAWVAALQRIDFTLNPGFVRSQRELISSNPIPKHNGAAFEPGLLWHERAKSGLSAAKGLARTGGTSRRGG